MAKTRHVYQFKIILEKSDPVIWREIQVPDSYNFWDLHVAIQDSMGWLDGHLHQFKLHNLQTGERNRVGIPVEEEWGGSFILPGWKIYIAAYFSLQNKQVLYEYDFGDEWEHNITLEKILPLEPGIEYPRCLAGKQACPPEDCGGIWEYNNLLKILKNPQHVDYQEMKQQLGRELHPEEFDPQSVRFDNPKQRWKRLFQKSYQTKG
jgi:hypothetical protein